MKVRSSFDHAFALVSSRGITFMESPSNETLEPIVAGILIREKGYPENTTVQIDGSEPMDLVLVVDSNGSWELV